MSDLRLEFSLWKPQSTLSPLLQPPHGTALQGAHLEAWGGSQGSSFLADPEAPLLTPEHGRLLKAQLLSQLLHSVRLILCASLFLGILVS